MNNYQPPMAHTVRFGELASRIYQGLIVNLISDAIPYDKDSLKYLSSESCNSAAIFMSELRQRDPATGELIHGHLPVDDPAEGYEE